MYVWTLTRKSHCAAYIFTVVCRSLKTNLTCRSPPTHAIRLHIVFIIHRPRVDAHRKMKLLSRAVVSAIADPCSMQTESFGALIFSHGDAAVNLGIRDASAWYTVVAGISSTVGKVRRPLRLANWNEVAWTKGRARSDQNGTGYKQRHCQCPIVQHTM